VRGGIEDAITLLWLLLRRLLWRLLLLLLLLVLSEDSEETNVLNFSFGRVIGAISLEDSTETVYEKMRQCKDGTEIMSFLLLLGR
jgi:hypothetical protein